MGQGRSLRKLAADAKTTSKLRQLQHWSSRWNWVERCQRYDDYAERQLRIQQEKERLEMHKRHAKIALLGQNIAVKGLENLLGKVQTGEHDVPPADLTRLLDTSVKVERMARGDPSESHEVMGPGGGPVRLDLAETLKRIDEIYGLKSKDGTGKTRSAGDESESSES
jgi:hypothetical protein